jgi:hypothetical protein
MTTNLLHLMTTTYRFYMVMLHIYIHNSVFVCIFQQPLNCIYFVIMCVQHKSLYHFPPFFIMQPTFVLCALSTFKMCVSIACTQLLQSMYLLIKRLDSGVWKPRNMNMQNYYCAWHLPTKGINIC